MDQRVQKETLELQAFPEAQESKDWEELKVNQGNRVTTARKEILVHLETLDQEVILDYKEQEVDR